MNMLVQVMPPMYRMLSEEIGEAIQDVSVFSFDYRCIFTGSQGYRLPVCIARIQSVSGRRRGDARGATKFEAISNRDERWRV
jgi:hypothetical protein